MFFYAIRFLSPVLWLAAAAMICAADAPSVQEKTVSAKKPPLTMKVMPMPVRTGDRPDEAALKMLADTIAQTEKRFSEKGDALTNCKTPEERKIIADELAVISTRLDDLNHDLVTLATDAPYDELFGVKSSEFTLNKELNDLVRPLLSTLKQATEQPRAVEELNNHIELYRGRLKLIDLALARAKTNVASYKDKELLARLEASVVKALVEEREEVAGTISVDEHKLEHLSRNERSLFETSTEVFRKYFRTRGLNVLLALAVFLAVFFGSRLLRRHMDRISPLHLRERRSFYTRLADVIYYAFSLVGAVIAAQLVFYLRGDWVLLSFSILFFVGLALAMKHSLPRVYEQTRMLLNLGEVREGERVVMHGVAWRVDALRFFSTLANPCLTGGRLRLPLRQMITLVSRPYSAEEPWFPCREGEWVMLDDATWGRVVLQTPDQVQLVLPGGERKTYGMENFLQKNPKNLSAGFSVSTTIGLDYAHQADITKDIPAKLKEHVQRGLMDEIGRELLVNLTVEFANKGQNSLDIFMSAGLAGEAAPQRDHVQRLMQRFALEACSAHGWKLPVPQLALQVEDAAMLRR